MERREQLEQMRRSWAARLANTTDELVGPLAARDDELAGELRAAVAGLRHTVAEMDQVRDTLQWVAACGGQGVPQPTGLFEVVNLLGALEDAAGRLRTGAASGESLPMNLDTVDIG